MRLFTTSEACSNVASVSPKSLGNSNPTIAMNPEVSSDGDKFSCLGSPFSPSTVSPPMRTRLLLQSNLVPMWLHLFQNQMSTVFLLLEQIPKSVLLEISQFLRVHHFCAAWANLKADKEEQEKKKVAALASQSNNDKDSCIHETIGNDEMVLEKSTVTKKVIRRNHLQSHKNKAK